MVLLIFAEISKRARRAASAYNPVLHAKYFNTTSELESFFGSFRDSKIVGPEKSQVMLCEGEQKFRVESEQRKRSKKRMNSRIHLRKFHAAAASIRLS